LLLTDEAWAEIAPILATLQSRAGGFDHGVGHSLLLLYDAKVHCSKNSNYFNGLCHYPSNTLYKFILNYNMLYHSYNYLIFLPFLARH